MTYILKHELTMGGAAAIRENAHEMDDNVSKLIDELVDGDPIDHDIMRRHVESAIELSNAPW